MRTQVHVQVRARMVVVGGGPVEMFPAGEPAGCGARTLAVETGAGGTGSGW
ncbi:hypothetical protein [Streptomyces prasinus]